MGKTTVKFNVIDRKQNQTTLEVEDGTTIKDAISNNLTPNNYGNCGGDCICGINGHWTTGPLYGGGCQAGCGEFPFLCRPSPKCS